MRSSAAPQKSCTGCYSATFWDSLFAVPFQAGYGACCSSALSPSLLQFIAQLQHTTCRRLLIQPSAGLLPKFAPQQISTQPDMQSWLWMPLSHWDGPDALAMLTPRQLRQGPGQTSFPSLPSHSQQLPPSLFCMQ